VCHTISQRAAGIVLLAAATLKAYQLATEPVLGDGLWGDRAFLATFVEAELLLGIWLLAGPFPKAAWRVAIISFALLFGISMWSTVTGAPTCGCFGKVEVNPRWTTALDLALVAVLWRWRPTRGRSNPIGRSRLQLSVAILMALVLGIPFGIAMGTFSPVQLGTDAVSLQEGDVVVLEPAKWVGRQLPILRYLDIAPKVLTGRWIVLFYHHDCPKCQAVIPDYERLASESRSEDFRVALVELPPFGNSRPERYESCVTGRLAPRNEWFMSTPCCVKIQDSVVQSVELKVEPGRVDGQIFN